mgnify:CR=1 FL=1
MLDLDALEKLHGETSKGDWRACHEGKCKCGTIWCPDYPVADVTRGEWGDTYPELVVDHDKSICGSVVVKAETKMVAYGEVKEEQAIANAQAIVALHNAFPEVLERLRSAEAHLKYIMNQHGCKDVVCPTCSAARAHIQKFAKVENQPWDDRDQT